MAMICKNILKSAFFSLPILFFAICYANTNQIAEKPTKLRRSEIFPPEDGKLIPLQGKIVRGRYYAPKNVFSCQADDFGQGAYLAQDVLLEQAASVAFYSPIASFKNVEVLFMPGLEKKSLEREALKDAFDVVGIGILKTVDNAQGIEILTEEMVGNALFFSAISVEKMSVLKARNGEYMSSTRGYSVPRQGQANRSQ
jgi:hypothetical protein